MSIAGTIFNIQPFSMHDGPGIRTTVFLKGCNLHCFWCHNPESIQTKEELLFECSKCIYCGSCMQICKSGAQQIAGQKRVFQRSLCIGCFKCVDVCKAKAIQKVGRRIESDFLLEELLRDRPFFEHTGGGITFSGGEPMLQTDFLLQILPKLKRENIHIAIDTAGNVPYSSFEKMIPYVDLFLFDIKCIDSNKHMIATGISNERILKNFKCLCEEKANIAVRIPVIPFFNNNEKDMEKIAIFLQDCLPHNGNYIELMPYHNFAASKYENLGLPYSLKGISSLKSSEVWNFKQLFLIKGLPVKE